MEYLDLVKRAKSGNEEAFIRLMELQSDCMYKMAKTILKNEEDVAECDGGDGSDLLGKDFYIEKEPMHPAPVRESRLLCCRVLPIRISAIWRFR